MSNQIAPCPFCGSESAPSIHAIQIGTQRNYTCVWCNVDRGGCGAKSALAYDNKVSTAIALWNQRAAPSNKGVTCV